MDDLPLNMRWGYLVKRAQAEIRTRMDAALAEVGLTSSQYAALANLHEEPGLSNAELARRSFVTPQTMVRIVAALSERRLVMRTPRVGNARVLDLEVTDAGADAVRRGHVIVRNIEQHMAAGLTSEERQTLVRLLAALVPDQTAEV